MATGDEDGTVKMWDNRKNPDGKFAAVMESRQFDEHVNDIFFDAATDDKIMVASSGEGWLCTESKNLTVCHGFSILILCRYHTKLQHSG